MHIMDLTQCLCIVVLLCLHVVDSRYCKPTYEFRDENGDCQDCPVCKNGEETKVKKLHSNRKYGAFDCYECVPCPYGTYSNDDYRIGNHITCVEWINCTVLERDYKIYPNSTTKGHCKSVCAKPGYYPSVPGIDDSLCFKCTTTTKDKPECVDFNAENEVTSKAKEYADDVISSPSWIVIVPSIMGGMIFFAVIFLAIYCYRQRGQPTSTPTSTATSSGASMNVLKESKALINNDEGRETRTVDHTEIHQLKEDPGDLYQLPVVCTEQEDERNDYELNETEKDWCIRQKKINNHSLVSLVCSRSILEKCNDKLYSELLPNRTDVIVDIRQNYPNTNQKEQCYQVINKWQQIKGDDANLFILYMAVFNTFLDRQAEEESKNLYKQLLVELKHEIQKEINIQKSTVIDIDTDGAQL